MTRDQVAGRRSQAPGDPETGDRGPGTGDRSAARVIVISPRDNVATVLDPLKAGQVIEANGRTIAVREAIAGGHKIALARIAAGDAVLKYGSPIGTASQDIEMGAHVHVHNVVSTRGRGDLAAGEAGKGR